jgi:hypothetical protein
MLRLAKVVDTDGEPEPKAPWKWRTDDDRPVLADSIDHLDRRERTGDLFWIGQCSKNLHRRRPDVLLSVDVHRARLVKAWRKPHAAAPSIRVRHGIPTALLGTLARTCCW